MDGPLYRGTANQQVAIASGGTDSEPVNNQRGALPGIILPSAFTGTSLSFKVSLTQGGTYSTLYDDTGVQVTLTVAQGNAYALPSALFPFPWFKMISNASETPARAIDVLSKG